MNPPKPFYRRRSCWLLSSLLLCVCSSFCIFAVAAAPSIDELNATKTVESAQLVAQNTATSAPTRIPTNTLKPVVARQSTSLPNVSSAVSVTAGSFQLGIQRVWEVTEASGHKPERVSFLILETTLYNNSADEYCFRRADFKADARGRDIEPSSMDHVRDEFYEGVDYPGPFNGQCVGANASEKSLLVYDIPENLTSITIEFTPKDDKAKFKLWLARQENGEYLFGLDSFSEGVAMQMTFTPIPTASNTPLPTLTFTPSPTPYYEPVPDAQGRVPERYQELITTLSQQVVGASSFLGAISDQVVKYDDSHQDGFFVSFSLDMSEEFNEGVMVEIRQAVRNILFDFYGSYSYLALEVKAHEDFSWHWDSETNETIVYSGGREHARYSPTDTPAPRPTNVPSVQSNIQSASGTRYINTQSLNVRACPSADCERLGSLGFGTAITLTGQSNGWYRIQFNGNEGWVASQYTSASQPSNQGNASGGSNPTSIPVQSAPTAVPVQPIPSGGGCNGASSCGEMTSCEQAYACLNAGNGRLDRDNDGVPCESICPGG